MARTPTVDLSQCNGCQGCLELCPDVFNQNEAGYIEVAPRDVYPEDCIQEAINCCPAQCIGWEESD